MALNNPDTCPHESTIKTGGDRKKQTLCLQCMRTLESLKKPTTLNVAVYEDIKTKDIGPGQS